MSATQHFTNKLIRLNEHYDRSLLNTNELRWLYSIQNQIADLEDLVVSRREKEYAASNQEIDVGV